VPETTILAPHIAQRPGVRGGRPHVQGKGVAVEHLAACLKLNWTPDEMACEYGLSLAEVYAALAFYFDHQAEIDAWLLDDERLFAEAKRMNPSLLHQKLGRLLD